MSAVAVAVALDYAALGWQVFPLLPKSKEPATKSGFYAATTNPATIRRWFGQAYPHNIGVRTGLASGIFVFDTDGETGALSLAKIEAEHEPFPPTRVSITGKGRHFWFRTTVPIACSAGKIAPGVDVRGDGGYVVAPPSVHPNGTVYKWIDDTVPPAMAPRWLIELTRKQPPVAPPTPCRTISQHNGRPDAYGQAALDAEIAELARAAPGTRNHALNRASFALHQLVAGGELEAAEVERRLVEAAHINGLMTDPGDGPHKTLRTIESGARAGLQQPRSRPTGGT
jgi:hypothetical protein